MVWRHWSSVWKCRVGKHPFPTQPLLGFVTEGWKCVRQPCRCTWVTASASCQKLGIVEVALLWCADLKSECIFLVEYNWAIWKQQWLIIHQYDEFQQHCSKWIISFKILHRDESINEYVKSYQRQNYRAAKRSFGAQGCTPNAKDFEDVSLGTCKDAVCGGTYTTVHICQNP